MNDTAQKNDDLVKQMSAIASALEESNQLTRKKNRIAKRQHKQSKLNYEQVERQYLIEKSALQPLFSVSVSEFLTCEPDFVNDPEQASEVKFLAEQGVGVDERVIRVSMKVKGEAPYMQPSLVVRGFDTCERGTQCAYAMSDLLYFIPAKNIKTQDANQQIDAYWVYKDRTTLAVLHHYQFTKRKGATLLRWDIAHLDTAYVASHRHKSSFNYAKEWLNS